MSVEDLDLDINNYNMRDLENFFQLSSNLKYTPADIDEKEYAMRTLLLSSGQVDKKQQKDLIDFLSLARDWLIFVKCRSNDNNNQPIALPNISNNLIDEPKCINGIIDTQVFLKNGPLVPLAVSSDSLSDIKNNNLMLDKTNAVVRGFDIPSAALNKEVTSIVLELKCSNGTYDYESNINFSKPIEAAPWLVNISDSEWSKREQ